MALLLTRICERERKKTGGCIRERKANKEKSVLEISM